MALVVREAFHLNGTLKVRGDVLTGQDAADVKQDLVLFHRCNYVPDSVFAQSASPPRFARPDSASD